MLIRLSGLKESTFIAQNEKDWKQLEALLDKPKKDADKLLHLFEKVSGDLAYARTYYPNRTIRVYLNNLVQRVLGILVKKRSKFNFSDVVEFYRETLPVEMYRYRKAFLTSFLVFSVAVLIGVISSIHIQEFATVVLGEEYIEMTEDNINEGNPMAVYQKMEEGNMFLAITVNNIRVSFLCFVLGLLGGIGTMIVLVSNGIMVGVFQYYFYQKGLFLTSFLTIWIHGTIEISSIIIAGGTGFILGNGIMFPQSHTRSNSLLINTKKAIKIILGIMPLFIIAGFLESFVTRHTGLPTIVKVLIILVSLIFIITTFIIYPYYVHRQGRIKEDDLLSETVMIDKIEDKKYAHVSNGHSLALALSRVREAIGAYLSQCLMPMMVLVAIVGYILVRYVLFINEGMPIGYDLRAFSSSAWIFWATIYLVMTFSFIWLITWSREKKVAAGLLWDNLKNYFLLVAPLSLIFFIQYYFSNEYILLLLYLIVPIHFVFIAFEEISLSKNISGRLLLEKFKFSFQYWFQFLPITFFLIIFSVLTTWLSSSPLFSIILDFISWHDLFGNMAADRVFVKGLLDFFIIAILMPLIYFSYTYRYASLITLEEAADLRERLIDFGTKKSIYTAKR